MKHLTRIGALAAAVVLFACCARELGLDDPASKIPFYQFEASFDPSTRTYLDDNGKVSWQQGDQVYFYTDGIPEQTCTVQGDGLTALFEVQASRYLFGVYGAKAVLKEEDMSLVISNAVKPEQDGSFADAHLSLAATTNLASGSLNFYNITSMIKFKVKQEDVAYVRVHSRSDAQLYGDVKVSPNMLGIPISVYSSTDGGSSVKVTTADKSGYFYMALLPGTYKDGIEVICYNANGARVGAAVSSRDLEVKRNQILDMGVLDEHFLPDVEDISELLGNQETANCYIVPQYKDYRFPAVCEGNSSRRLTLGTPVKATVLWETYGTTTVPTTGTVITDVSYSDGYVYFTALRDGSALVAVRDAQDNILWSWHIWVWLGYDIMAAAQEYYNGAGSMMDRNLGAISATIDDPGSRGMLYQWGRKDPFFGALMSAKVPDTVQERNIAVATSAETGSVEYAAAHPMSFIYYTSTVPGDWLTELRDDLWNENGSKSSYDPCPPGWKVPDASLWSTAVKGATNVTKTFYRGNSVWGLDMAGENSGYYFGSKSPVWYPVTGFRNSADHPEMVSSYTLYGYYWSNGVQSRFANTLLLRGAEGSVNTKGTGFRANGYAVRCQLDYKPESVPVSSITLSESSLQLVRYAYTQLTATVAPSYADDTSVSWKTSNASVATVSQTGMVTAEGIGECDIIVSSVSNPDVQAVCHVTVSQDAQNLLAPANCFIVDRPGTYSFNASIRGNNANADIQPAFAGVLWTSYGDATYPTSPVITNVSLDPSTYTLSFNVPNPMIDGNAVIAVRNTNGAILWSWHIWACSGFDPDKTHYQNYRRAGVIMDRNLGATSSAKGNVHSLGLLYQWGRKDPFLSAQAIGYQTARAVSDGSWPPAYTPTAGQDVIAYTILNPTTFINGTGDDYDWLITQDDTLWGSGGAKSLYDPCPAGWRVPEGGKEGFWVKAAYGDDVPTDLSISLAYDMVHYGYDMGNVFGVGSAWFPFSAYIARTSGNNSNTAGGVMGGRGQSARQWTATPTGGTHPRSSQVMMMDYGSEGVGSVLLSSWWSRAFGASVRCVKE